MSSLAVSIAVALSGRSTGTPQSRSPDRLQLTLTRPLSTNVIHRRLLASLAIVSTSHLPRVMLTGKPASSVYCLSVELYVYRYSRAHCDDELVVEALVEK